MPKLRVHSFGMSIDGYGAGPTQSLENPLGVGGLALHEWAFKTRTFHAMVGEDGGETGVDDDFVARGGVRRRACPDGILRPATLDPSRRRIWRFALPGPQYR